MDEPIDEWTADEYNRAIVELAQQYAPEYGGKARVMLRIGAEGDRWWVTAEIGSHKQVGGGLYRTCREALQALKDRLTSEVHDD